MVSIIIPIYNEEKILRENLKSFKNLSKNSELIFVAADTVDNSLEIIEDTGKIFSSKKGRAVQMNRGALSSEGDILLFLHADTTVYPETIQTIERAMEDKAFVGGCLSQHINITG